MAPLRNAALEQATAIHFGVFNSSTIGLTQPTVVRMVYATLEAAVQAASAVGTFEHSGSAAVLSGVFTTASAPEPSPEPEPSAGCPSNAPRCLCRMVWQDGCMHPSGAEALCQD